MMHGRRYGAIVLAAGRSQRMGEHKLLLPLGGQPLVAYSVEAACASTADVIIVVLGHAADNVRAALPPGRYHTVVNQAYASGMASSLRVGIRALVAANRSMGDAPLAGAAIALADQPLVSAGLFDALFAAAASAPDAIVVASYAGEHGQPVLFPAGMFPELERVAGDQGGREVLAQHAERVRLVEWPDTRAALDIDRPEDYERMTSLLGGEDSSTAG
jgi:molybdenum cofactor cytidylyltransferase